MTTQQIDPRETETREPVEARSEDPTSGACCGGMRRRQVLRAAGIIGVAGAGAATLAACGGSAEDAADEAVESAGDAVSGAIEAASIPVGGGRIIQEAKVVITQPTEGDFKAFSAVCTHQSCLVSSVEDNVIMCTCHGSQFDATTGAVKEGPASDPLPEKSVTVGADGITVT